MLRPERSLGPQSDEAVLTMRDSDGIDGKNDFWVINFEI
jgi:hypothetical protein